MAKQIKMLELHYPMIQFLIIRGIYATKAEFNDCFIIHSKKKHG